MNTGVNKKLILQALTIGALAIVAGFLSNAIAGYLSPSIPNTGYKEIDSTRKMNISNFLTGLIVFIAVSIYGYTCQLT